MQKYSTIIGVIKFRSGGISFPICQRRYSISSWTVQDIMSKYVSNGIAITDLEQMPANEVEELFYPSIKRRHRKIPLPDFDDLFEKLQSKGKKISKTAIWEEYNKECPDGYQRSQMLEYYNRYMTMRFGPDDLSMAVNRIPGERIYIDYCGDKAYVHIQNISENPNEQQAIHLFLTTCGFSSKIYSEAFLNEQQESFNSGASHAIEYYGAVPRFLVPDNLRTGVHTNTKDKVIINASFQDLEAFYETIVLPPPYRKPRGKATAERYVNVIEKKVIEKLEAQYIFRDLEEINRYVMEIVEAENNTVPRGYSMTHNEMFEVYDRPAMKPLKDAGFLNCEYSYCARVPNNYHVPYDQHFYSVPNQYYNAEIIIKATADTIRLCDINNRMIAEHKRCYIPTIRYITKEEHMPANHRFYKEVNEQNSEDYLKWAEQIGSNMKQLIYTILKSARHEEQMYRACNGILHMCSGVPKGICEEAAADCIKRRKCQYSDYREVLSDLLAQRKSIRITATLPEVEDTWGKDYYS